MTFYLYLKPYVIPVNIWLPLVAATVAQRIIYLSPVYTAGRCRVSDKTELTAEFVCNVLEHLCGHKQNTS
ncbi:MAG: hypothetical protein O7D30_10755, partial [Rickettsia endosymbiont of Ixodes persulcatus]|nr:hypothetical protein [Rickettsia endosymbiont of Ixodes persulcatus]